MFGVVWFLFGFCLVLLVLGFGFCCLLVLFGFVGFVLFCRFVGLFVGLLVLPMDCAELLVVILP